jgi:hypothetical protein
MGTMAMDMTDTASAGAILRDELARANRALRGLGPVLSHRLESEGTPLVSDAIVARLRGMLSHLAIQCVRACDAGFGNDNETNALIDKLANALSADQGILGHLYALAMEGYLAERLAQRSSIDPVLSPLLQELIASSQAARADLAMTLLASQSRFCQSQRRMELSVQELPADLFTAVLARFEASELGLEPKRVRSAIDGLKSQYDEGDTRLGLIKRLVASMGPGAMATLDLGHAGLALFATGLAVQSGQERDFAVLSCHEGQSARLALGLRAAGLEPDAIESQLSLLNAAQSIPAGIAEMSPERASALVIEGEKAVGEQAALVAGGVS